MKHDCETHGHEYLNGLCFNERDCRAQGKKVKKQNKFIHTADPEKNILSKCSIFVALKKEAV